MFDSSKRKLDQREEYAYIYTYMSDMFICDDIQTHSENSRHCMLRGNKGMTDRKHFPLILRAHTHDTNNDVSKQWGKYYMGVLH